MGWPISHSRSPILHGYWLKTYKIDGVYLPFPVAPKNLEICLRTLPKLGFVGSNITVPHKEAALKFCDRIDDLACQIGAVNTIVVEKDGSLSGSNTDAFGFLENLRAESNWNPNNGPTMILGAGGSARAILVAMINAGIGDILITNRSQLRSEQLASEFAPHCTAIPWGNVSSKLNGISLLINATTLGMSGQPPLELSLDALPVSAVVYDIVYSPLKTNLLRRASQRGNPVVDGLGMLLHQARPGFGAWFGHLPEVTGELRKIITEDLTS